jgi:hypothetical protein
MKYTLKIELEPCAGKYQYHMKLLNSWAFSNHQFVSPKLAVEAAVREAKNLGIPYDTVEVIERSDPEISSPVFRKWLERMNKKEWRWR